ncbi:MAG: F420-dependent NADP oxidoreductase [Caldilineae bacterium]|nr:MAG: F420-dependent NADP oxidoreductase [Caldilineae bacterium]
MKIGMLGTGVVGKTLGARWGALGHTIIYGSREPESPRVQALVAEAGPGSRAASTAAAAAQADVVVLATRWDATEAVVKHLGDLHGKVLIDCTNPIAPDFSLAVGHTSSGGELVALWAQHARVVKAFNTTGFNNMEDPSYPEGATTMFICGDDADAKAITAELSNQLGFDTVDCGPLQAARFLEPAAMLWISLAYRQGLGREIAFRLMRR